MNPALQHGLRTCFDLLAASAMSPSDTILYRENTASVLWTDVSRAVFRGTPGESCSEQPSAENHVAVTRRVWLPLQAHPMSLIDPPNTNRTESLAILVLLSNTLFMESIPHELVQTANLRGLILLAALDWAAIAGTIVLALLTPTYFYPLWLLLIAGRLHAIGVVLHDVVHMPIRRKSPTIRVIEFLAGYPIGTTIEAMRYHHLRHHRDLGLESDPYLKAWVGASRLRFWAMSLRYFFLVPLWVMRGVIGAFAAYLPGLRGIYGRIFLQDRSGEDLTQSRELLLCAQEDRWQTLFHAAVAILTALWPRDMLAYYLLPLVAAGYLAGVRLLLEHVQEPSLDSSRDAMIRSTRNHHLGWTGKLLLAPHNVGYHLIHHLHPQAASANLPEIQKWYERCGALKSEEF